MEEPWGQRFQSRQDLITSTAALGGRGAPGRKPGQQGLRSKCGRRLDPGVHRTEEVDERVRAEEAWARDQRRSKSLEGTEFKGEGGCLLGHQLGRVQGR